MFNFDNSIISICYCNVANFVIPFFFVAIIADAQVKQLLVEIAVKFPAIAPKTIQIVVHDMSVMTITLTLSLSMAPIHCDSFSIVEMLEVPNSKQKFAQTSKVDSKMFNQNKSHWNWLWPYTHLT